MHMKKQVEQKKHNMITCSASEETCKQLPEFAMGIRDFNFSFICVWGSMYISDYCFMCTL